MRPILTLLWAFCVLCGFRAATPRNTKLLPAPSADRLPLDSPTLAKAMKAAGDATFFAGK